MKKTERKPIKDNEKEAIKFIEILETADGGCSYCVRDLLERFIEKFPQYRNLATPKILRIKKHIKKIEGNS